MALESEYSNQYFAAHVEGADILFHRSEAVHSLFVYKLREDEGFPWFTETHQTDSTTSNTHSSFPQEEQHGWKQKSWVVYKQLSFNQQ